MNNMQKVLFLASHFPPSAHVGAKRVAKFCKYLPQHGCTPIVITRQISQYHLLDESLNDDLPPDLQVHRAGSAGKNGKKKQSNFKLALRKNTIKNFLAEVYDFFVFYDYPWLIQAFLRSKKIIRDNDVKVVFATYPNTEPLLVGFLLKIFLRVKLVCEFRDPWSTIHYVYPTSFFKRKAERLLEYLILSWSNRIVTVGVNMKQLLINHSKKKCKDKVDVIYNGYDKDDFVDVCCNTNNSDKFKITYTGTWGNKRSPENFLRCLASLLEENNDLIGKISVKFIGEVKFDPLLEQRIDALLEDKYLKNVVEKLAFLPKKEALAELSKSHVLLLVERPSDNGSDNLWVVTSKIFDYLYIKKPVLAIVPENGEAAEIVRAAGTGIIVEPGDLQGIKMAIHSLYKRFMEGTLNSQTNHAYIDKFSRKEQAGQLAVLLDKLVTGKA